MARRAEAVLLMNHRFTGLLAAALLLLAACTRPDAALPTAGYQPPQVIGHAGSGFFTPIHPFNPLPPSSLAGIRHALDRGAVGVEIDLQLSRDSVPMLFHDVDLANRTFARGFISQYTAAELRQMRYTGGWPYDWFQHERIATFAELLTELAERADFPYLHLDLHEHDGARPDDAYARSPALTRALGRVLRRYQVPQQRLLVLTDHLPSLARLRRELPGATLGLEITERFAERLPLAAEVGADVVVLSKNLTTPEHVAAAHARHLQVVSFGGRSPKTIRRLLAAGPDGMEVDNVPAMRRLLRRAEPAAPEAADGVAAERGDAPNSKALR